MDFLKNFMGRFSGGMNDGQYEQFFDKNPGGLTEWTTGGDDTMRTYNTWNDYDAGKSSGSYFNASQSPSFVNQFGGFAGQAAKSFLKGYNPNKSSQGGSGFSSMIGGGGSGGTTIRQFPGGSGRHYLVERHHPQPIISTAPPSPPKRGFFDYALPIASLGLQAASLCDERIKVDMAPLESSDINDDLAKIAFFVKGLRECA